MYENHPICFPNSISTSVFFFKLKIPTLSFWGPLLLHSGSMWFISGWLYLLLLEGKYDSGVAYQTIVPTLAPKTSSGRMYDQADQWHSILGLLWNFKWNWLSTGITELVECKPGNVIIDFTIPKAKLAWE